MRRKEAAGPVTITNKTQVGTGDRGVLRTASRTRYYLIGNPVLTEGPPRGARRRSIAADLRPDLGSRADHRRTRAEPHHAKSGRVARAFETGAPLAPPRFPVASQTAAG